MIKLKDLLLEKKEVISVEKSQDMRKSGYWTLLTRNLKKVIAVDKDEKKLRKLVKKYKGSKLFSPLRTVTVSAAKMIEYEKILVEKLVNNKKIMSEVKFDQRSDSLVFKVMSDKINEKYDNSLLPEQKDIIRNYAIYSGDHDTLSYFLKSVKSNIFNTHLLVEVDNVDKFDLEQFVKKVYETKEFEKGVNVEIFNLFDKKIINARVYERGVGETDACGSGAVCMFYYLYNTNQVNNNSLIFYPGGELEMSIEKEIVKLSGEVTYL